MANIKFWKREKNILTCVVRKKNSERNKKQYPPPPPTQGLAVIFSLHQVYVKREGRTLFLLPKVKIEFWHLFSLPKPFSLCSYHNINANIVVFC